MISETKTLWNTDEVQLRQYQEEIFQRAVKENLLIVLATSLGKTYIGAKVIAHMIGNSDFKKAILLAPTRPLIDQHLKSLKKSILIKEEQFCEITGQINDSKRLKIYTHQNEDIPEEPCIYVMTPQTLKNDLLKGRISLKNVGIVVFDEAHRARGQYAYCIIADYFKAHNPNGRIVAMTASPGASKEKIAETCNNLHIPINNTEFRSKSHKSVKDYTHEIDIYKIGVKLTDIMTEIRSSLYEVKKNTLLEYIEKLYEFDPNCPKETDYYYLGTIINYQKKLNMALQGKYQKLHQASGKQIKILLSITARVIKVMNFIDNLEAHGLPIMYKSMETINNKIVNNKQPSFADKFLFQDFRISKIFRFLKAQFEREEAVEELVHPKIKKLVQVIRKRIDDDPDSRILVFTKLRNSVQILVKNLNSPSNPTIKARKFVGQASKSKSDKGMSQKVQIEILEKFREGKFNVLVATSVAEEGLDIAECNMVVFYDNSASEIKLIQRMGRTGRSSRGTCIILYTKDTNDERYLKLAKFKTSKMGRNLGGSNSITIKDITENNSKINDENNTNPEIKKKIEKIVEKDNKEKTENGVIEKNNELVKKKNEFNTHKIYLNTIKLEKYWFKNVFPIQYTIIPMKNSFNMKFDIFCPKRKIAIDIFDANDIDPSPANFTWIKKISEKRESIEDYSIAIDVSNLNNEMLHRLVNYLRSLLENYKIKFILFKSLDSLHIKISNKFS